MWLKIKIVLSSITIRNRKSKLVKWLFILYIVSILVLLVMPTSGSIKLSKYIFGIRTDHFIHACLFLPFMGYIWIRNLHKESWTGFVRNFLIGILFAAFCESLHYFIKYRSFDVHDFFANSIGLTLGNIVFLFKSPKL